LYLLIDPHIKNEQPVFSICYLGLCGSQFAANAGSNMDAIQQQWWLFRKQWYGDAFQNFIDDHLKTSEPKSMYSFNKTKL
jgi:hypothetical protein